MLNELKKQFLEVFGGSDEGIRVFSSPGRVNLIGEHTDYNGGYVFPAALTMATTIIARPRTDSIVRMKATDLDGVVEGDLNTIDKYKDLKWGNYQFGIFDELRKAGYNICGADMLFHDTTPHGGGLSSSAAIEVSAAIAMASLGGAENIDNIEMAKISQTAEHNYIGVNCGIMDQFASAMGKANHVIFLNCKNLEYSLVPMKLDGYKLVISNTNKKRSLADSKYNERRSECEAGLEILKTAMPDKTCLGDISIEEYEANKHLIRGISCLQSGIVGKTDNITIKSIVGRFLEHSRIYIFGTPDRDKIYISSADFMTRNTLRRVEVAAPVYDSTIKERIRRMFEIMFSDNVKARVQQTDGTYIIPPSDKPPLNSQEYFYDEAYSAAPSRS